MNQASLFFFIKVFFSAVVVYFLGKNLNFQQVKHVVAHLSYSSILFCIAWLWIGLFTGAKRWQEIIACNFRRIPLPILWSQVLVGAFLNQCLPSSVGGDVYRGFMAKRHGLSTEWAINSTLIDRFYGVMGLILVGLLALPFEFASLIHTYLGQSLIICLLLSFLGFIILLLLHRLPLAWLPIFHPFVTFSQRLWLTFKQKSGTFRILFFSILTSSGLVIPLYILALDMNLKVSLPQILITIPFIFLISVLPFSFAGWGLREGAMVVTFALFGISKESAFALSVVFGFIQILASLPGLIVWLFHRPKNLQVPTS